MPDSPTVHIIDDDPAMQDSLRFLVSSAALEVAVYESAADFLARSRLDGNDCVLSDVQMPGMSGIELLRRLRSDGSCAPVIVMTGRGDMSTAVDAMRAGAFDFLEKPFSDDQLLSAIENAMRSLDHPEEAYPRAAAMAEAAEALTDVEKDILDLLVQGSGSQAIAETLGLTLGLVEIHRARIMSRLEASNLSELFRSAFLIKRL